jgi:hypothetical protein
MRRREFITFVRRRGGCVTARGARAQRGRRMRRIGVLMSFTGGDPDLGHGVLKAADLPVQAPAITEVRSIDFLDPKLPPTFKPATRGQNAPGPTQGHCPEPATRRSALCKEGAKPGETATGSFHGPQLE